MYLYLHMQSAIVGIGAEFSTRICPSVDGGGRGGVSTIKITWADTRAAQRRRHARPYTYTLYLYTIFMYFSSVEQSETIQKFIFF